MSKENYVENGNQEDTGSDNTGLIVSIVLSVITIIIIILLT